MDRTPQRSCAARGLGCSSQLIIQAARVCVREKMAGKGQDDAVVSQGAAVPRGRSCGQTENNHPAPTEGGEPRPAIKCAMPQCLAWTSIRPKRMPWVMSCTWTDQGPPGGCQPRRRARRTRRVAGRRASLVLGLTSPGAGRQPRTWQPRTWTSRTRASVSGYYLACGRARRRPSITVVWTAARWKRRPRRDPCAAHRPHRRKPPRCASRSTGQAGAVRYRPTPADRILPRRA